MKNLAILRIAVVTLRIALTMIQTTRAQVVLMILTKGRNLQRTSAQRESQLENR